MKLYFLIVIVLLVLPAYLELPEDNTICVYQPSGIWCITENTLLVGFNSVSFVFFSSIYFYFNFKDFNYFFGCLVFDCYF